VGGTVGRGGGAGYLNPFHTRRRVELFGLTVDPLTMDETVEAARELVAAGGSHQHVAVNAAKVVAASNDSRLAEIIRGCDLVNADGIAVVWASRLLGAPLPERVAGIDLFERLVGTAARDGRSVYFLGARPGVVARVAEVFRARHPGLEISGFRDGYWGDDDEGVVEEIRHARPDYLFLAVPSPRKEYWLSQHLSSLRVPFAMGVGGSFDVVAGRTGRAPKLVQRLGLEWAWRLAQEPRRMWRRYLVGNLSFIRLTALEWRRARS
jgi:N-acetylglucosaminyldiphosphoundecaprenol N-acetyl-beta-D-mannosaminyltransferase